MAAMSASGSPTPIDSMETNAAPVSQEETMIKDDQWRAIKRVIENLYAHREQEYDD